jgi:L-lactate permease
VGEALTVKVGVAVEFTVRLMVVLAVVEPEVPVMVTVAVPVVAVEEAVSVRVDVTLPSEAGVTGLGEKEAVTPEGRPLALSVVEESKPFSLVMVMVLVPLLPWVTVTEEGEALTVKVGDEDVPSSAFRRLDPFILPQPSHKL